MYDVVLLDLDNTILDFDSAEKIGFIKVVESMGLKYSDALLEQYQKINTSLWHRLEQGTLSKESVLSMRFSEFFKLHGMHIDGSDVEIKYRSYLNDSSALVPNAAQTLTKLKLMGKKLYSASNGIYTTQIKRLSNAGIMDLFDGHFISDKIKHEKPSPYFFDYCFNHMKGVSKSAILMVGDSPTSDVQGAINAGIKSCFYQHNKSMACDHADYIIRDISELLEIV